jgi:hypothetical protein
MLILLSSTRRYFMGPFLDILGETSVVGSGGRVEFASPHATSNGEESIGDNGVPQDPAPPIIESGLGVKAVTEEEDH